MSLQNPPDLPTDPLMRLTVAEAARDWLYFTSCETCSKWALIDLGAIAVSAGAELPVRELRNSLRCKHCGGRSRGITFIESNSQTGRQLLRAYKKKETQAAERQSPG